MFTASHMTANAEKLWLCLWLCLALIASMKLLNCTISVIHRSKQLRFCASDRAVYEDQGSAGASEAVHIWIRVWDWECLGMFGNVISVRSDISCGLLTRLSVAGE